MKFFIASTTAASGCCLLHSCVMRIQESLFHARIHTHMRTWENRKALQERDVRLCKAPGRLGGKHAQQLAPLLAVQLCSLHTFTHRLRPLEARQLIKIRDSALAFAARILTCHLDMQAAVIHLLQYHHIFHLLLHQSYGCCCKVNCEVNSQSAVCRQVHIRHTRDK